MTTTETLEDAVWPINPTIDSYTAERDRILSLPLTPEQQNSALSVLEAEVLSEFKMSILMRHLRQASGCSRCLCRDYSRLESKIQKETKMEYSAMVQRAKKLAGKSKVSKSLVKKIKKLKKSYETKRRKKLFRMLFD